MIKKREKKGLRGVRYIFMDWGVGIARKWGDKVVFAVKDFFSVPEGIREIFSYLIGIDKFIISTILMVVFLFFADSIKDSANQELVRVVSLIFFLFFMQMLLNLVVLGIRFLFFFAKLIFREMVNFYFFIRSLGMKKIGGGLGVVGIVCGILFFLYIYQYQQLVNAGNVLEDEHCLVVNPLIIDRKNAFKDSMAVIASSGSAEEFWAAENKYNDISKKYIDAENSWLSKDQQFMKRADFIFLLPSNLSDAADFEYRFREADMNAQKILIKIIEAKYNQTDATLTSSLQEEQLRANSLEKQYNDLFNVKPNLFDKIRNIFVKVPPTKCPAKNFIFPNWEDIFKNNQPSEEYNYPGVGA